MKRFTDNFVKHAKVKEGTTRTVYTDPVTRLRLRVQASSKRFAVDYTIPGKKRKTYQIGSYPAVSLADAQDIAKQVQSDAAKGIEPGVIEVGDEADQRTVAQAIDMYVEAHLSSLKSGAETERVLRANLPTETEIRKLSRDDVLSMLRAKRKEVTEARVNRIRAYVRAFLNWAYDEDIILSSLTDKKLGKQASEKPRNHVPTLEDMRNLYTAAGDLPTGPAARVLMLTGARLSEITQLKRAEVDLENARLVLDGSRTKNGDDHIIYLSDTARDIIANELDTHSGEYVFRRRALNRLREHLVALCPDLTEWRTHDFRKAFATHTTERGGDFIAVEMCLGHDLNKILNSAIASTYNRAALTEKRQAAMRIWDGLLTGTGSVTYGNFGKKTA